MCLSFLFRLEIGRLSPHFGGDFLAELHRKPREKGHIHWRKFKKSSGDADAELSIAKFRSFGTRDVLLFIDKRVWKKLPKSSGKSGSTMGISCSLLLCLGLFTVPTISVPKDDLLSCTTFNRFVTARVGHKTRNPRK